ncbi:MAG TPA: tetratricopeptide repeat protein [Candidatus Omnitrophota bacterium]|nr:tetratricopeptide repeat protein [Candidatus Omnitrophota bacterium]HPD83885.1 tetratricopeptide repeat protein [Candidatus Omnitrophota bacterium]HRZ02742.1 tetratricopeptide repeat protein [Candidatus Omnitrophota bacterium]
MNPKKHRALLIGILVLLTFLAYGNSLFNSFVWDDQVFIVSNPFIRSLKYIPDFFQNPPGVMSSWGRGFDTYYRPFFLTSFTLDYHLWGLKPFFFHLYNVLLHIICTILVFYFARRFIDDDIFAFLAALFFGLHPVHTDAVTPVYNRMDILVSCFSLGSFLCFSRFLKAREKGFKFYLYSLLLFSLALFSKEFAIMLPVALFLYDFLFVERNIGRIIRERWLCYLGIGAVLFFYMSFRFLALGSFAAGYLDKLVGETFEGIHPVLLSFYAVFHALFVYIQKLFLPVNLNVIHQYSPGRYGGGGVIAAVFLVAAGFYYAFAFRNKRKEISFWILWFFIMIFPVSQIIPFGNIVAERYVYLPSVGFCCLLGYVLMSLYNRALAKDVGGLGGRGLVLVIILVSAFYLYQTVLRNYDWRTEFSLWKSSISQNPFYTGSHTQMAKAYAEMGREEDAEREYIKALSLSPNNSVALNSLGSYYVRKGRMQEGLALMLKALRIDPQDTFAYINVGRTYNLMKEYDLAIKYLRTAKLLNKGCLECYFDLGLAYANKGEYQSAAEEFKEALAIDPNFAYAYYGLGLVNFREGNKARADTFFQKAIKLNPNFKISREKLYEQEQYGNIENR